MMGFLSLFTDVLVQLNAISDFGEGRFCVWIECSDFLSHLTSA